MSLIVPSRYRRQEVPVAPDDVIAEVRKYAAEHGRTGHIQYVPMARCWVVRLSLKPNDPALAAVQGQVTDEKYEDVWLMEPNPKRGQRLPNGRIEGPYVSLNLEQLGPSGVRAFLDKGNRWSGRGEVSSIAEAARKTHESHEQGKQKARRDAREWVKELAHDVRRQVNKIPLLRTGIDLKERS